MSWKRNTRFFLVTAVAVFVFSLLTSWLVAYWIQNSTQSKVEKLLTDFQSGAIQTRFRTEAFQLRGESKFQFATMNRTEIIERTSELSLFWKKLRLPDVVVKARVPVSYTYFLDFEKDWVFRMEGDVIRVYGPPPEHNRPAADFSQFETHVEKGSWLRNEKAVEEGLKADLTEILDQRAAAYLPEVRETARRKAQEFIQWWLERAYSQPGRKIEVIFDGEDGPPT